MTRDELRHVIRAVATHTGLGEVVILGSQAILGTADHEQLPVEATRSVEADVAVDPVLLAAGEPTQVGVDATVVADEIDGAFGELSPFHATFGYYAQGVEVTTAVLPEGWRERLRPLVADLPNGGTAIGWCLDLHDLWISKAAAGRQKDAEFCHALATAGWVDHQVIAARVHGLSEVARNRVGTMLVR